MNTHSLGDIANYFNGVTDENQIRDKLLKLGAVDTSGWVELEDENENIRYDEIVRSILEANYSGGLVYYSPHNEHLNTPEMEKLLEKLIKEISDRVKLSTLLKQEIIELFNKKTKKEIEGNITETTSMGVYSAIDVLRNIYKMTDNEIIDTLGLEKDENLDIYPDIIDCKYYINEIKNGNLFFIGNLVDRINKLEENHHISIITFQAKVGYTDGNLVDFIIDNYIEFVYTKLKETKEDLEKYNTITQITIEIFEGYIAKLKVLKLSNEQIVERLGIEGTLENYIATQREKIRPVVGIGDRGTPDIPSSRGGRGGR